MANHAILSASSSHRWLNCPPSARLCEAYEDKGSDYAAEGTDAHALCEFRLKQALGIPAENPIENLSWYNEEMEDFAAGYQKRVRRRNSRLLQKSIGMPRTRSRKRHWRPLQRISRRDRALTHGHRMALARFRNHQKVRENLRRSSHAHGYYHICG